MYSSKFLNYLLNKYKVNKILNNSVNEKIIYEIIFDALDLSIHFINEKFCK